MSIFDKLFRRDRNEQRASYTQLAMQTRYEAITGRRGLAELTGTVQGCVNLWSQGLSIASTTEPLLTPSVLALAARSLALRGEALFVIRDGLVPVSEWDLSTRAGKPVAYRVTIPDVGGGKSETVLADEVLHFKIGSTAEAPWRGTSPLRRASLTAGLLHAVEDALAEVFSLAPLGSQVVPMPESPETDNEGLASSFRGQRGRVLLRESVNVSAAGGPVPVTDWKPSSLSPDLSRSMTTETLAAARDSISFVYGVLPALMNPATTGPMVREAQRHLAQWRLQPIAAMIAAEAGEKLGTDVSIDVMQPLQAYDAGGRARALNGVIAAMATAKEAGLSDEQTALALKFSGVSNDF